MLSVVLLVTQFALATIAIPFLNNAHSPLARRTVSIAVAAIPSDSSDLIRLADNQATNINLGDTEIALKGPGANIPDQADALSTPDSFNVAVEPSLLHPCPNSYCVCAEKYQYFPAFRVQPCHECAYSISFYYSHSALLMRTLYSKDP